MKSISYKKIFSVLCSFLLVFCLVGPTIASAQITNSSRGYDSLLDSNTSSEIIINSLLCNRVSSVAPNSSIEWTINATGDNLRYKYDLYKDSTLIHTSEDISNIYQVKLNEVGTYYLKITITNQNNISVTATSEDIIVKKIPTPIKIHSVESSVSSLYIGGTVKFTSYASGDSLTYSWEVYKDNKKIYTSNYSTENYLNYKVTQAGNFKVLSIVKDVNGTIITQFSPIITSVKPIPPKPIPPKPTPSVESLVKPSIVYATLTKSGKLTSSVGSSSTVVSLPKGSKVEILSDKDGKWYNVRYTKSGKRGWIASSFLSIPKDPPTNKKRMTAVQMEQYVNQKGFSSETQYFIWVDIDRQLTNIFSGKKGSYKLVKSISCATGRNRNPTTRGTFTVANKGSWFYAPSNPSVGAKYFTQFNGSYLFHSTLYSSSDKNKPVDSRVGTRLSHGCIRLPLADAKWIYSNAKSGTKVFVN